MNRIYRLIWNACMQRWVAVGEHVRSRSKSRATRRLCGAGLALWTACIAPPAFAGPTGGVIAGGAGAISQANGVTAINQNSSRMAINWNSFSTSASESIVFRQPDANAIALNRIVGAEPSTLLGSLSANGQVFITNPNGVLFGPGAQVNVQGLLASSLDMAPDRFMAGILQLQGGGAGGVLNQGALNAASGGYIALLGPNVRNEGAISAPRGAALMAAGDRITVNIDKGSLLDYHIDAGSLNALADNSGRISADGGRVTLAAAAANGIGRAVVNHSGIIEARTLDGQAGEVRLLGDMTAGQLTMSGSIDASAPAGGDGGQVETSAAKVRIDDGARVRTLAPGGKAGTWLIDPDDFVINAGSGAQTSSSIGATTLSTNLAGGSITLQTGTGTSGNGDIFVNAGVSWSAATTLRLSAARDIFINANVTATDAKGKLELAYGTNPANTDANYFLRNGAKITLPAGQSFSAGTDPNALEQYSVITSLGQLQSIATDSSARYALGGDIAVLGDGTKTDLGKPYAPIQNFFGKLDGLGHVITGLTISSADNGMGVFATTQPGSVVRNIGIDGGSVSGNVAVGGLVAVNNGLIENAFSTASVSASGGGTFPFFSSNAGGLVGRNAGTIVDSYAIANVTGKEGVGGLVGANSGSIVRSYADSTVVGESYVGGLVGNHPTNVSKGSVTDSYATSRVTGNSYVGGLLGYASGNTVTNTYSSSTISGTDSASTGGLIGGSGDVANTITSSYWVVNPLGAPGGVNRSAGGTPINFDQSQNASTFQGWFIDDAGGTANTWRIYSDKTAPLLRSFLADLSLNPSTVSYDGSFQSGPAIPTSGNRSGIAASGKDASSTAYRPYSEQRGYDISGGELFINPAVVTVNITTTPSKVYDGTTDATGAVQYTVSGAMPNEQLSFSAPASFADKNVGTDKSITISTSSPTSGLTGIGTTRASNYIVSFVPSATIGNITPRDLTVSASGQSKVYDGTPAATVSLSDNRVVGDMFDLSYASALFADVLVPGEGKNAGTGKTINVSGIAVSDTSDAKNYTLLNTTASTTASITPKALNAQTPQQFKTYDGTTTAATPGARLTVSGVIGNDEVDIGSKSANYSDKNVGDNKIVTYNGVSLSGKDAGNYTIADTATGTGNINQRPLSFTVTPNAKDYDGNTAATVTFKDDRLAGDSFSVSYANASFNTKDAGVGKRVAVSGISLSGPDSLNYKPLDLNPFVDTGVINQASLRFSVSASNKSYDGTVAATAMTSFRVIDGDDVRATYGNATFADKNVGTGKEVTVPVTGLSGSDAQNYRIDGPARGTADITPRTLHISATGIVKVYDGSTAAAVNLNDDRITGDDLTAIYGAANFANKNVGTNKSVSVAGIALGGGADARNYVIGNTSAATAADITPRPLNVTADIASKTYDGSVAASAALKDDRIAGDDLKLGYGAATFADANAGSAKAASVAGIALAGGADAANYALANTGTSAVGTILKKPLSIVANPDSKAFDGKPYAGGNGVVINGFVAGDDASVLTGSLGYGGNAQGASAPGTYHITPSGLDAANYAPNFGDGLLTIRYASLPTVALAKSGQDDIYAAIQQQTPNLSVDADRETRRLAVSPVGNDGRLNVAGCGLRMPEGGMMSSSCAQANDATRCAVQP